ncbi:MAG: proline racemase family protein [Actinomycetota bacterium]
MPAAPHVRTVDLHTAGEPFRLVAEPPIELPGSSVADRRVRAVGDTDADRLRRFLCHEPRGHVDMYGGFLVPPDDDDAHLGVLFWHKDGFSTACGHGTIAIGVWAIEEGVVAADPSGITELRIDVPSGRVVARVHHDGERVRSVDFVNVASSVLARGVEVETSLGSVIVDVADGGAIYAHVEAGSVGLAVEPDRIDDLVAIGREIKWALNDREVARHPTDDRLSGIYGTILYDDLGVDADGNRHQRNVTVFADGEVDRSPCGSGTCSRLAVLADDGVVAPGGPILVHDSIIGSRFEGRVTEQIDLGGRRAWIPVVTGTAHRTGEHVFVLDPDDELAEGFLLG